MSSSASVFRPSRTVRGAALLVVCIGLSACDTNDGRELKPARPEQNESMLTDPPPPTGAETTVEVSEDVVDTFDPARFNVVAPWGGDDGEIAITHTCRGEDKSPELSWSRAPEGTAEVAVVVTATESSFVHWVVWGLPAEGTLAEGDSLEGFSTAMNDFERIGYGGPCPEDNEPLTYDVGVFAMSKPLAIDASQPTLDIVNAIYEASTDEAHVSGRFP